MYTLISDVDHLVTWIVYRKGRDVGPPANTKGCYDGYFVVTGSTRDWITDNIRCHQWQQSWHLTVFNEILSAYHIIHIIVAHLYVSHNVLYLLFVLM